MILVDSVDPEPKAQGWSDAGLKRAIATLTQAAAPQPIQVLPTGHLEKHWEGKDPKSVGTVGDTGSDTIWCPLTTQVEFEVGLEAGLESGPESLRSHPLLSLTARCGEIERLQQQISEKLGCETGEATLWLPVVVTAKGPLYAEAIAPNANTEGANYQQPFHLSDRQRQTVYRLAHQILDLLSAPPAVYLLGLGVTLVGKDIGEIWFDRILPFPGEPAIASLGIQTPDLFDCHWRCITGQPIRDITI